ncbi:MAG: 16S rRNA (adenine(1518)-N(6)/adenine(1519)-N(6))-dimethyltransferase RsmA [Candidatus Saccharimonadales bacterium]
MNIPKKSLGQHWLYDETTLSEICRSAKVGSEDTVLEIGPGLGTLTKLLVENAKQVIAVEFDEKLAEELSGRVRAPNLTVSSEDILKFDLTHLPAGYKVVANIPYYLTSNLIRVLCESTNPFSQAAILIQKEVAQRVCAKPGQMSMLSVSAQFYCETSLGIEVPAEMFTPPPKVDSQVIVLNYRSKPLFPDVDVKQFFRLVRAGFSQKRKTLVNSLSGGLSISKDEAKAMLDAADIAHNTRAQALSLDDWYALYEINKQ